MKLPALIANLLSSPARLGRAATRSLDAAGGGRRWADDRGPVTAGGLVYCAAEDGLVQVVKPGDKEPEVVGSGSVNETLLATPAVADGALYLRSDKHLWKFGK